MQDAMNTASAKTALVSVSQAGMEDTVQWKVAPTAAHLMVSADSTLTQCGSAGVKVAGLVKTAAYCWNRIAMMDETMIKVGYFL